MRAEPRSLWLAGMGLWQALPEDAAGINEEPVMAGPDVKHETD
jgi:hypothetical protein